MTAIIAGPIKGRCRQRDAHDGADLCAALDVTFIPGRAAAVVSCPRRRIAVTGHSVTLDHDIKLDHTRHSSHHMYGLQLACEKRAVICECTTRGGQAEQACNGECVRWQNTVCFHRLPHVTSECCQRASAHLLRLPCMPTHCCQLTCQPTCDSHASLLLPPDSNGSQSATGCLSTKR